MQALAESRSEHVQSILNLDDQLAIEQQTRQALAKDHDSHRHYYYYYDDGQF